MEFEEIPPEEVRVGDWFEHLRISNRKQKIPKIDRDKGVIKTITKGGGKVELPLDGPDITFYRNIERPPPEESDETETEDTEGVEEEVEEDDVDVSEEEIQAVREHLDDIDGIGPSKIDNIIDAGYNTIEKLRNSEIDDLTDINGIGESKAKDIKLSLIQ